MLRSYNIYSETMQAYVFSSNLVNRSVVFDVPDGILRLELYQNFLVSSEVVLRVPHFLLSTDCL